MWICFQFSAVFGNNFDIKLPPGHISHALLLSDHCLLVNNSDTPFFHLSLNDSSRTEHIKSEMKSTITAD